MIRINQRISNTKIGRKLNMQRCLLAYFCFLENFTSILQQIAYRFYGIRIKLNRGKEKDHRKETVYYEKNSMFSNDSSAYVHNACGLW